MVKGLDLFQKHFEGYADQFILIGGTAATLAMERAGLEFRATKDLDIVLHIEVLKPGFGAAFWEFVEKGGYGIRESSETGKPMLYRFQKPEDARYPFMLELFCRSPDGMRLAQTSQLTPIPLDDSYYGFILEGRRQIDGLSWIGEDRLSPLKAHAWLDLSERKARGEPVDSKNIRKHANDVMRLSQLLSPESRIATPGKIAEDLSRFLQELTADETYTTKSLDLDTPLAEVASRIARAYLLEIRT